METGIRYLDGNRLSRATRAGAQWLIRQQNVLNDINVFPVPDGDTGTNMAFTMRSIFERMDGLRNRSVGEVCSHIADAALMGARGNSGAILAQFFQGLAEQLKHHRSISTETFAQAVQTATDWPCIPAAVPMPPKNVATSSSPNLEAGRSATFRSIISIE